MSGWPMSRLRHSHRVQSKWMKSMDRRRHFVWILGARRLRAMWAELAWHERHVQRMSEFIGQINKRLGRLLGEKDEPEA